MLTEIRPAVAAPLPEPRRRARPTPGEVAALLVGIGLAVAVALDAHGWARTALAVAFVAWTPGSALAAWFPHLTAAERRGVAVASSLALSVLAPTVAVWLHWWHPGALLGGMVVASSVSLVVAMRRPARARDREDLERPPSRQAALVAVLLVVATGSGVAAMVQLADHDHVVGRWGLLTQLPITWFVAAAALAVAAASSFRLAWRPAMAACPVLLVGLLHGTTAVAYDAARFAWTYKHLGVTDYILDHGQVRSGIDIYHDWPGFFSMAAFLFKAAGLTDPMGLLRWWPALIGIGGVVVLRFFFGALTDDRRIMWAAVTLFVIADWFGQDYFSPQSVSFLIAFGILGLLLRTTTVPERLQFTVGPAERRGYAVTALVGFAIVTFTHQLTPYLLLPGIVIACVLGGIRPRWLGLACAAIAFAYLAPRYGFVRAHGGLGHTAVGDNVRTPAAELSGTAGSVTLGNWASRLLTGGLGLASIPYLLRYRRDRWWTLFLVSNLVGPASVLLVQAYGNEGVLRAALFVTPWMAFSAASTLMSERVGAARVVAWVAGMALGIGLFVAATWGLDARYRVGPEEVRLVRTFEATAPRHAVLAQLGAQHLPVRMTSRYPELEYAVLAPFAGDEPISVADELVRLERDAARVARHRAVYIGSTASADTFSALFGYGDVDSYGALRAAIRRSPRWEVVLAGDRVLLARYRG